MPRTGQYLRASCTLLTLLGVTAAILYWHGTTSSALPRWPHAVAAFGLASMLIVHMALLAHALTSAQARKSHAVAQGTIHSEPFAQTQDIAQPPST